jgi:ABC-type branched-subunit amino acid transport system substrate-binding protein
MRSMSFISKEKYRTSFCLVILFANIRIECFAEETKSTSKKTVAIVLNLEKKGGNNTYYKSANSYWINQGVQLGIEDVKKTDSNITFQYFDDHGTPEGAIEVSKQINNTKDIDLVISGYFSLTSVPLANNLKDKNLFVVFASAKDAIANPKKHGRLVSDNDYQGRQLVEFAQNKLKAKKLCFIYSVDDGFSLQVKRGLEEIKSISINTYGYRQESIDELEAALNNCHLKNVDAILHSGVSTSARALINIHTKHQKQIPIVGTDGWGDVPKLLSEQAKFSMRNKGLKLYFLYYWDDIPITKFQKKLNHRFYTKYKDSISTISALGYDAIIIASEYLKQKTKNNNSALTEFLKNGKTDYKLSLFNKDKINAPLLMKTYEIKPDGSFSEFKKGKK